MGRKRNAPGATGQNKVPPLSAHPPLTPLLAERGEWRAPCVALDGIDDGEMEEQQVWSGYCVSRQANLDAVVTPTQVILRARRDKNTVEFCRIGHDGFALNEAMRAWVSAVFGAETLVEIDGEISRLAKRQAGDLPDGADIWQTPCCDFKADDKRWWEPLAALLSRLTDRLPELPGPSGAALLALLITAGTAYLMAAPLSWWWHGRVADDLVALPAVVIAHEMVVEKRTISGGHKQPSKGFRYVHTPQIGFRALAAAGTVNAPQYNTVRDMPEFSSVEETQRWMRDKHPLGQELTLWFRPPAADHSQADFIHLHDQLPDGWDLLRELLIDVLLTTFIYLPIAVLAVMGVSIGGMTLFLRWRGS